MFIYESIFVHFSILFTEWLFRFGSLYLYVCMYSQTFYHQIRKLNLANLKVQILDKDCLSFSHCILFNFQTFNWREVCAIEKHYNYMYVITNLINSTRKVDLPFFHQICKDAQLNLKQNFKWFTLANDFHVICGHVCDAIEWNDGYALGDISEVICLYFCQLFVCYLKLWLLQGFTIVMGRNQILRESSVFMWNC